jgi:hypothetical protein
MNEFLKVPEVENFYRIVYTVYSSFRMTLSVSIIVFDDAYMIARYHSRGSMKLNACIFFLAHMVYL